MSAGVEQLAAKGLVGRNSELGSLLGALRPGRARVVQVSGVAGIGKSSLLHAFAARAQEAGAAVIRLDCRNIEPSVPGLLAALAQAGGADEPSLDRVAARLASMGPVAILLDTYERFWLMDTYIRRELCPALSPSSVLIMAGREAPTTGWLTDPNSRDTFRGLELGALTEREALEYLDTFGIAPAAARRINAVTRGHPLALTIAAQLRRHGRSVEDAAAGAMIEALAGEYLSTTTDAGSREALEAASVLRRVTESLAGAMLPDVAPAETLDRLRALPFVESASDGLFIHDAIRDAISMSLMATSPERYSKYRVAAWHQLQEEVRNAGRQNLWRYTADILYLLQKPVVREAFFPSGYLPMAVEPASAADHDAIKRATSAHDGSEASEVMSAWWNLRPDGFRVCRDAEGNTPGFSIVVKGDELGESLIVADPIAAAWSDDLRETGAAPRSLMIRRVLDLREGEGNSGSRAAFGLDVKRTYMEMRPNLRYIYLGGFDRGELGWCDELGFRELTRARRKLDGRVFHTFRLDMGPGSVDGWLAGLVARELGIVESSVDLFDAANRELVLDGGRVGLTSLEFGVMRALQAAGGRPVSRADLLQEVWGFASTATSNVVDVVVMALRRKLADRASVIQTVRGTGYRYRP